MSIPDIVKDSLPPRYVIVSRVLAALGMIALLITAGLSTCSCVHADGTPLTRQEQQAMARNAWRFTRDAALMLCEAIRSPLSDAVAMSVQGAQVPIVVAKLACGVIQSVPTAHEVVVDEATERTQAQ